MKEWYKWWFCVAAVLAVLAHCASPVAATYYGTYCVEPAVWYDVDGVCVYPGTPQYTVVVNRPGYVGAGAVGFAAGKASNYRPNYGRPDRPGGPGGDRPAPRSTVSVAHPPPVLPLRPAGAVNPHAASVAIRDVAPATRVRDGSGTPPKAVTVVRSELPGVRPP